MMYPFLTLDGETEIVHSEMLPDERVKVYIEKPDAKDGFHHATCYLPSYEWVNVFGFSDEEIARYQQVIESTAHLIMNSAISAKPKGVIPCPPTTPCTSANPARTSRPRRTARAIPSPGTSIS